MSILNTSVLLISQNEGYFLLTVSVISSPSCEIVFASLEKKLPTFSKKRGRFSKFRGRFSKKSPSFFEKRCSIAFPSLQKLEYVLEVDGRITTFAR